MTYATRSIIMILVLSIMAACSTAGSFCPVTEPQWILPPDDPAVNNEPAYGYYYANDDQTILASAGWIGEESYLRTGENGNKMGWFRPEGADLVITGRRLDGESSSLEAHVPCCYPTRFQATGLAFPAEGYWEVTAKADDNELTFVVRIEP